MNSPNQPRYLGVHSYEYWEYASRLLAYVVGFAVTASQEKEQLGHCWSRLAVQASCERSLPLLW